MKLQNLSFAYGEKKIFSGLNLEFEEGITCLMGASGSGKTTLLYLLAGLREPGQGTIEGKPAKPAMVFQENRLFPWLNVLENVLVVTDQKKREEAVSLLKELEIDPQLAVSELSGGMARRVALVRALIYDGDWLLLDEPFSGLNQELIEKTAAVIRNSGKPAVVSTHSLQEAEYLKSRIVRI